MLSKFLGQRFRLIPTANKQIDLRALDNPFSHAIRNAAQFLRGQRHVAGLPGSFLSLGQSKSAIRKRNKARFNHGRVVVLEYLLDAPERLSSLNR